MRCGILTSSSGVVAFPGSLGWSPPPDGNQVRLMSCGILPTSSPGVGAFSGLPGRFVALPASFVSLWVLLRIRGFCDIEFEKSAQQQPVWSLTSFILVL